MPPGSPGNRVRMTAVPRIPNPAGGRGRGIPRSWPGGGHSSDGRLPAYSFSSGSGSWYSGLAWQRGFGHACPSGRVQESRVHLPTFRREKCGHFFLFAITGPPGCRDSGKRPRGECETSHMRRPFLLTRPSVSQPFLPLQGRID